MSYKFRICITRVACRLIAYDNGYRVPFAYTIVPCWLQKLDLKLEGKQDINLGPGHKGILSYVDQIERSFPGYLRVLCRYVVRTLGARASFAMLAICVNKKSRMDSDFVCILNLSRRMLNI